MRAYITGTLSNSNTIFLPENIFFAAPDADDTDIVSDKCIELEGTCCESSVTEDGRMFHCRWKGVTLRKANGEEIREESDTFSIDELIETLKVNKMPISNMSAFYDEDVNVNILAFTLLGPDKEIVFPRELLTQEPIEFIS